MKQLHLHNNSCLYPRPLLTNANTHTHEHLYSRTYARTREEYTRNALNTKRLNFGFLYEWGIIIPSPSVTRLIVPIPLHLLDLQAFSVVWQSFCLVCILLVSVWFATSYVTFLVRVPYIAYRGCMQFVNFGVCGCMFEVSSRKGQRKWVQSTWDLRHLIDWYRRKQDRCKLPNRYALYSGIMSRNLACHKSGNWRIGNGQVQAAKDGSPYKAVLYPYGIGMFAVKSAGKLYAIKV